MSTAAPKLQAARHQVDPIEHNASLIGAMVGAAVGLVVGGLIAAAMISATIATGGAALVVFAGVVAAVGTGASFVGLFKDIGKLIGSFIPYNAGDIKEGSPDVTVGGRHLQAARVEDPVKCHNGKKIAEGCEKISINQKAAARVEARTECNGKIKEGCATVHYGGPLKVYLEIKDPDDPAWFFWFTESMDWLALVGGVTSLLRGGLRAALRGLLDPSTYRNWRSLDFLNRAYDVADKFYFVADKYFGGAFGDYINRLGGQAPAWLEKWSFTESTEYQVGKILWGSYGARNAVRDAAPTLRSWRDGVGNWWRGGSGAPTGGAPTGGAPRTSSDLLVIPPPPPGMRRTDSGLLVPETPPGYRATSSGLIVPNPPPRLESPSQGIILLPGTAPRFEAPRPPSQGRIILPGTASRVEAPAGP